MPKQTEKILKKIEFLKRRAGYSDRDIAKALQISPSGYSRIKNNQRRLTIEHLEKLADFFKVPFFYLFFTEGDLESLSFAGNLKTYLKEKNWTYEELAKHIGLNVLRVIELSQGATPTKEEVRRIISTLGIKLTGHNTIDGRVELIKLLLEELELDESRIAVILEYIEQN
ncbi:hypothetical protein BBF96_10225 [Anoxybacter fermentans]|uniref:HTH cro/C1-type domain-containing protein n=1 Tax=Anoxybacter fermentans TaxID=1323375 RepID=A0A3S9SZM1_9FIRM|nr:helix-turn-helix domain-containing protein [Anoxybacter fermentans]AZR73727.1 hypothetical protein BBF96_10225 [Anoxybacter fermentans]